MVNRPKILVNIFSNWTNLLVLMLIAFFVSPILVHQLGKELYGIWTIIVQITGYFTVLDFGVNTAIVRFISKYTAQKDTRNANEIFNTSFLFFFLASLMIATITLIFGFFFPELYQIESITKTYAYVVFVVVGLDIAGNLLFGVFAATLNGLQEFLKMNVISIALALLKNAFIVILLFQGYKLLTIALLQVSANALRHLLHYLIIRRVYPFLHFQRNAWNKSTLTQIFSYSVYSFIIAIAGRIIFLTDALVIGKVVSVSAVTFYAIPATLLEYLAKIVGAITGALVPVISSHDAVGEGEKNRALYIIVTRYVLAIALPIIFGLYTVGDDFITIWMGAEYGLRGRNVLYILLSGYIFSFSQWIAYGTLMGTSKHKFLAYMLVGEAVANLGISIVLGRIYGIEGVAIGTMIPLIIVNLGIIPVYTCRTQTIPVLHYFYKSHLQPFALFLLFGGLYLLVPIQVSTYGQLVSYSAGVAVVWVIAAFFVILDQEHRQWVISHIRLFI